MSTFLHYFIFLFNSLLWFLNVIIFNLSSRHSLQFLILLLCRGCAFYDFPLNFGVDVLFDSICILISIMFCCFCIFLFKWCFVIVKSFFESCFCGSYVNFSTVLMLFVMMALYIILLVRHLLLSGQLSLFWQLHLLMLFCAVDFYFIVFGYYFLHVVHAAVINFDCVFVDDFW